MEEKEVVAKIENPSFGRDFVGCVISSDDNSIINKKIFIPYVLPGELVKARIIEDKKNFLKGELVSILEESKFRITPECPLFYKCGGCHYQHVNYDYQLKLKLKVVQDYLKIQSKIEFNDIKILGLGEIPQFNYRKRAVFHISEKGEIGFFAGSSRDVIDINSCNIISHKLNECLNKIKDKVSKFGKYFYSLVLDSEDEMVFVILKIRDDRIFAKLKKNEFKDFKDFDEYKLIIEFKDNPVFKNFSQDEFAGHFSQVNIKANKFLIDFVLENVNQNDITELYAGAGNFSFPLARKGKSVVAVELDERLVNIGKSFVIKEKLKGQIDFIQSSCENFVKKNKLSSCVILDPPRSGAKEVIKRILPADTQEIIYISCSLPSFQRDLKELLLKGYKLEKLAILDMFPQTYHIEVVALIKLEKAHNLN